MLIQYKDYLDFLESRFGIRQASDGNAINSIKHA